MRQRYTSSRSTRPSTSAAHRWLSPTLYSNSEGYRPDPEPPLAFSAQERQRSMRRPRRRHKPRRCNEPPAAKRAKRKSACSDTIEESFLDDCLPKEAHPPSTRLSSLHQDTIAATHLSSILRSHQRCTRVVLSHFVSQREFKIIISCAAKRRAQDPESSRYPEDNLHKTFRL